MENLLQVDNVVRYQSFVIFEPASFRIQSVDVLAKGWEVKEMVDSVAEFLNRNDSLKNLILQNRLSKIEKMMDLVSQFDNVILTKFLDRIWRRYSHLSNLGETFLDLKTFRQVFPNFDMSTSAILAQRLDDEDHENSELSTSTSVSSGIDLEIPSTSHAS